MLVAAVPLRIRSCRKSIEIVDVLKTNGNTLILHDSCVDFDGRNASDFFLESFIFLRLVVEFLFLRCPEVRVEISVSLNFYFSGVQRSPRLTKSEVSRGPFRNNLKRTSGHFN